jgi:hypothetical protein
VSTFCGGRGLNPPAQGPFTGTVTVREIATSTDEVRDLGAGCLYIGSGNGSVPGGATPDGATTKLTITGVCSNDTLVLSSYNDPLDPDDKLSCSRGGGPGKSCFHDLSTFPLPACTTDADCSDVPGSCVNTPNCFFGPPLPIENGGLSTCVVNSFGVDASGTVNQATGESTLSFPLRSHTFITSNSTSPCPTCDNGTCTTGALDSCTRSASRK